MKMWRFRKRNERYTDELVGKPNSELRDSHANKTPVLGAGRGSPIMRSY
jgi:hypothetical protein